jgi:hypothetical protein
MLASMLSVGHSDIRMNQKSQEEYEKRMFARYRLSYKYLTLVALGNVKSVALTSLGIRVVMPGINFRLSNVPSCLCLIVLGSFTSIAGYRHVAVLAVSCWGRTLASLVIVM